MTRIPLNADPKRVQREAPAELAESDDASASLDLLIRALLATGATLQEIGQAIAQIGENGATIDRKET